MKDTWERATGRLFDAKRPLESVPVGCCTPPDGTLFIVEFLEVSAPDMF